MWYVKHFCNFPAAHCVAKPTVPHPVDPDTLLVYLGKHHLKQWSEGGIQDKQVSDTFNWIIVPCGM